MTRYAEVVAQMERNVTRKIFEPYLRSVLTAEQIASIPDDQWPRFVILTDEPSFEEKFGENNARSHRG